MSFKRDDGINADGFEQCGNVTNGDGIVRLGAAVLPRIAQIGRDRRDSGCTGVLQGRNEKEQPAEFVVWAFCGAPMQTVHDIDIATCDRLECPDLVLTVFKATLFEHGETAAERISYLLTQHLRTMQRKQAQPVDCSGR